MVRSVAKVAIFLGGLFAQEPSQRIIIYEEYIDRYFGISNWSTESALSRPDTIRYLRLQENLPHPLPKMPRLEGLYLEAIDELDLEALLQSLPQKCPKLSILALEACDIVDLAPFSHFSISIRGLLLDQNGFTELTPLTGLKSLEFLSIAENPVRSIEPLRHLPRLKAIDIRQTAVTDISMLSQLQGLRLFSAYKAMGLRDLSPLFAHQATLEMLNISFLPPAVTMPIWKRLREFQALKVFQAQGAIPDATFLPTIGELSGLESLLIGQSPLVTDLSFVKNLRQLLYLDIHSCQVQDLSPLTGHPNLVKLIMARNPITRIAPLGTCPRLADLYCYEVPATDWETLLSMPSLAHVMLSKHTVPAQSREALFIQLRRRGVRVDAS